MIKTPLPDRLKQAWNAIRAQKYAAALSLLDSMNPLYNESHQYAKVICLFNLQRYSELISFVSYIQRDLGNSERLLLARSYQHLGNYQESLQAFKKIPDWEKDKKALLGLARCYEEMEHYEEALKIFYKIPDCAQDKAALLSLARCYEKIGHYAEALQTYMSIPGWNKDKTALLSLARCYQEIEHYAKALQTYTNIPGWNKDKIVLLSLARCYQEMNCYADALQTYFNIPDWDKDKTALLSLARCYQEIERYEEALQTFTKIPGWEEDKTALLGLARCYEEMGNYAEALQTFRRIPNWAKDKTALLGLARCYQEMGKYVEALQTFRKIPEWAKDKTALLGLARCYQEMGSDAEAISYYTTLRGQFPFSTEGHYAFCCFAVERQLPDARLLLKKALQTWPYFVPLYLLKARHQMHQNDADGALDTLQQANQQFPYSTGAKLALIKYYLMRGQLAKALDAQKQCWALFPGHHKLFSYIEKLIQAKELILAWASDFAEADEKVRRVALPASLLAMFKSLEASGGEHYLTGSSVLSLLTHQPILPAQDLDFVSVEADAYQLKRQGFYPSPYLPNLFAKHRKPNPVSTWLVSTSPIMQPSHAALSRDYTISCLFCDKDGTIYDPTGYGLEDLKHKRLRAIGNPVIRLQEDPARVLRAVKYMALGFKPMPDLDAALRDWKPVHLDQHKPHLDAVLRKHLTSSLLDKKRFIQLLQDYGLLQKILGLKPKASIEQTTALLEHALGIRHKMSDGEYNAARFFAQQPVAARIPTSPKNPRYAEIKEQTDNEKTLEALDLAGFWGLYSIRS